MLEPPSASLLKEGLTYAMDARLAVHYERHLVEDCGYRSHVELAELAVTMGAQGGRWLDFGAGSGLVGRALAKLGSAAELVAVDCSGAMLELIDAPAYVERVGADCTATVPLPNQSFDGALAAGLLEHLADTDSFFRNVASLLKAGGHFLFTYPPHARAGTRMADAAQGLVSHDTEAVSQSLRASGFAIRSEREFEAYRNGSQGWMVHRLVACVCSKDGHGDDTRAPA